MERARMRNGRERLMEDNGGVYMRNKGNVPLRMCHVVHGPAREDEGGSQFVVCVVPDAFPP
jgi:hypothetical protein